MQENKDGISQAVVHLATNLQRHYENQEANKPIATLLGSIATISDHLHQHNLAEWEAEILSSLSDAEWEYIEAHEDFPRIELVWEVGRSNLFAAIDAKKSREIYNQAAIALRADWGMRIQDASSFDFSSW